MILLAKVLTCFRIKAHTTEIISSYSYQKYLCRGIFVPSKPSAELTMLELKLQSNARFWLMGLCGAVMALSGILTYAFNPLDMIIKVVAVLTPNSIMFNIWTKPPYEVLVNIYIFNFTNHNEFLHNKTKLRIQQIGPYVYQEVLTNGNGRFNDNNTLTFEPKRELILRLDKSVGDPNIDWLISPNIPLLGISSSLKDSGFFTNLAVAQIANMLDSQQFLNLTIQEYLYGYDDRLVTLANEAIPSWINFPRFGIMDRLMALDNGSNTVTIKTVSDDLSHNAFLSDEEKVMPYTITRFNGSPGLPLWGYDDNDINNTEKNSRCNTIEGSFEGGIFPAYLNENSSIRMYRRAFCRPVEFKYESDEIYKGYDAVRFRVNKNFLAAPSENPDNACYCYKGKCPVKGLSYLTPCYYGIPVTISQPHFYNADPTLLEVVEGLSPNKTLHDSSLRIHKKLGVPLEASLRIQINLDVDTKYSTKCRPFNGMIIPLFWLDLRILDIPSQVDQLLYWLYVALPLIQEIAAYLLMIFGVAAAAAAILFTFFFSPRTRVDSIHGLEDPYHNIGYSPIRIIPMTQYLHDNLRISK